MKVLTLDELYDIFESPEYDDFRADFNDDIFINRKNPNIPTFITGLLCMGGKVPLVYQHIIAERLFSAKYEDIIWQDMDAYHMMTLLSLVYLWMYPLTCAEGSGEELITFQGRIIQEMYDESRLAKVWDRANRLFEDGVLYFVDELPINTEDNIELGMIKNTHEWEYITPNVLEIVGEIVQGNLKRQERWEACQLLHAKTLRYSIMFIEEKRGGKQAAKILRLFQTEWSILKLWKAQFISLLSEDEIQQFENSLLYGFERELKEWDEEASQNNSSAKLTIATDRAIKAVYESCLCDAADWAAVVKIMEEKDKWPKSIYTYAANYINNVCGENVTSANSLSRSIIYTRIKGTYPNWEIKLEERSREVPNKLRKYLKIGEIFTCALEK